MSSLSRSLKALNCPFAADFSITSREHVVILVRWLEDRKIREYDIQERVCLQESPKWETHFNAYLERLGCPFMFSSDNPIDSIAWLISFAVSLDYDDCEFDAAKTVRSSSSSTTNNVSTKLNDIGGLIGLRRNLEEVDTEYLARIYQALKFTMSGNAVEAKRMSFEQFSNPDKLLEAFPLGFDTQDKVVNQVALVMKMLYLSDFRDLQNEINSLLVLVQEYTANPRLNASLGRVGV